MTTADTSNWTKSDWDRNYQQQLNIHLANARFLVVLERYLPVRLGRFGLTFVYNQAAENQPAIANRVLGGGLMSDNEANTLRRTLFNGAVEWSFESLDADTQDYITHQIAPLEWQPRLEAGDKTLMGHIVIWGIDRPTVPAKPVPPSGLELLATGLGLVFATGLFSGAEKAAPQEHFTVRPPVPSKLNLEAFVSVTLRELPIGVSYWDLSRDLRKIRSLLSYNNMDKAVFMVKEMSYSSDEIISMWANRCMTATGIPV